MSSQPQPIHIPRKPYYVTVTTTSDFFELFKQVEAEYDHCFMLESLGEEGYMSRYSLIGFDPEKIIWAQGQQLHIAERDGTQNTYASDNPYHLLRDLVPQNVLSRRYAGGLTGYLGYDATNYFEPSLKVQTSQLFDSFRFGVFMDGLIYDKMTGEVIYFHYQHNRVEVINNLLARPPRPPGELVITPKGEDMTQVQHAQAVDKVKQNIVDGNVFQCEVGFKYRFDMQGDAIQVYAHLREENPSPQMYYLKFDDQLIMGASPELLFRCRQGEMETYPLAGTVGRGANQAEDTHLARHLLNDPKEIAEHKMIVDLHRNDIGRVARFGTVKVRNLMDIKRYSHVQHISSEVVGIMAPGEDMFTALASNFPAGTLTGAPKIEAMKIIDTLEIDGRGPYGGAVGHFGFNGDCTFAIPIRTIFAKGKQAYVQTCGGNVYDSNAEDEYAEIQRKFAGTLNVLKRFMLDDTQTPDTQTLGEEH